MSGPLAAQLDGVGGGPGRNYIVLAAQDLEANWFGRGSQGIEF